jgi:hypothetical protein
MGAVGRLGNYLQAGIFFVVRLRLLGVIPMPWSWPGQVNMKRKGLLAAPIGHLTGSQNGVGLFRLMAKYRNNLCASS